MLAVFITTSMIILRVAVLSAFCSFFSSFIAFIPSGVEALPSPRRLEIKFITIYCIAAPFLSISGKRSPSGFANTQDSFFTAPERSATFITPFQRQIVPQRDTHSVTASLHDVSAADDRSDILPVTEAKRNERHIITKIT